MDIPLLNYFDNMASSSSRLKIQWSLTSKRIGSKSVLN